MMVNMVDNDTILFDSNRDADKKTDWKTESIINKDMFLEILSKVEGMNENNKIKLETKKILKLLETLEKTISES